MKARTFFASLLTEDDGNQVPDLGRIGWFLLQLTLLIGITVFFIVAILLALAILKGVAGASFEPLKEYATAFAILFTGAGATMGLCAAALAIKTRSGA